jgi:hypothetical protein
MPLPAYHFPVVPRVRAIACASPADARTKHTRKTKESR